MATASTITERTYKRLKSEILDGLIWPGSRLIVADIATSYGISQTPVRESLGQLAKDDLIRILPRRGAVVTQPTSAKFQEVFEIRRALEGTAVKLACPRLQTEDFSRLDQAISALELQIVEGNKNALNWVEADDVFHKIIHQSCGNGMLTNMLSGIFDHLRLHRLSTATSMNYSSFGNNTVVEHRAIFTALRKHDAELAEQCMVEHIDNARERTKK